MEIKKHKIGLDVENINGMGVEVFFYENISVSSGNGLEHDGRNHF